MKFADILRQKVDEHNNSKEIDFENNVLPEFKELLLDKAKKGLYGFNKTYIYYKIHYKRHEDLLLKWCEDNGIKYEISETNNYVEFSWYENINVISC